MQRHERSWRMLHVRLRRWQVRPAHSTRCRAEWTGHRSTRQVERTTASIISAASSATHLAFLVHCGTSRHHCSILITPPGCPAYVSPSHSSSLTSAVVLTLQNLLQQRVTRC